jgi:hypothetical protein
LPRAGKSRTTRHGIRSLCAMTSSSATASRSPPTTYPSRVLALERRQLAFLVVTPFRTFSRVKTRKCPEPQFALNPSRARLSAVTPLPEQRLVGTLALSQGQLGLPGQLPEQAPYRTSDPLASW